MEAYITTIDKIINSTEAFDIMKMNDGACVKTFLTSNRSYRYYLLTNGVFTTEQKEVYLQIVTMFAGENTKQPIGDSP